MSWLRQGRAGVGALLLVAASAQADYRDHPRAAELARQLRSEHGFSEAELALVRQALGQAQQIPALIEAEQKAAEKTETWTTYAAKRVDEPRIRRGAEFLAEHRGWLAQAEREYGVPPAVIAGVLGLETNFGRITGKARVLDALATQGFEHPTRSAFFFSELVAFFAWCRDGGREPTAALGSYAGAMGWAQFMPSNYRRLAVDFDGDGQRDLWSAADAIGSIARYFNDYDPARRWQRGLPLAVPASLTRSLPATLPRNQPRATHSVGELQALGIQPATELPASLRAGLIELQTDQGPEYWVGLANFYSVMSYNPRVYYAMTVTQLAQAMAARDAEAAAP
ncbi:MAG TPA: lytic murein transglycosylase B [Nevskiaceae bacterium]|nr:lytic murein transglycosylase B [Nevskiaceae bacterium]